VNFFPVRLTVFRQLVPLSSSGVCGPLEISLCGGIVSRARLSRARLRPGRPASPECRPPREFGVVTSSAAAR
jgi:hypothetical protein